MTWNARQGTLRRVPVYLHKHVPGATGVDGGAARRAAEAVCAAHAAPGQHGAHAVGPGHATEGVLIGGKKEGLYQKPP